jgi:hypothetical protein
MTAWLRKPTHGLDPGEVALSRTANPANIWPEIWPDWLYGKMGSPPGG